MPTIVMYDCSIDLCDSDVDRHCCQTDDSQLDCPEGGTCVYTCMCRRLPLYLALHMYMYVK